jgi:hypothetical protein
VLKNDEIGLWMSRSAVQTIAVSELAVAIFRQSWRHPGLGQLSLQFRSPLGPPSIGITRQIVASTNPRTPTTGAARHWLKLLIDPVVKPVFDHPQTGSRQRSLRQSPSGAPTARDFQM